MPDGVIIAGHKRVAAAKSLGWAEVAAWVRDDLVGDDAAVERRLVEDNLTRRQLGPLAMARCYKALKVLERTSKSARLTDSESKELRDQLGKRLNCSGRTLDRYLRVLDHTPQVVQDAVESGALPLTLAEKVASLNNARREQIAKRSAKGATRPPSSGPV